MLITPQSIFGLERNWPETLDHELPIFPRAIARKAKLHPRTLQNAINASHAPYKSTIQKLATGLTEILGFSISTKDVATFWDVVKSEPSRPMGYWEYSFRWATLASQRSGGIAFFPYTRKVIVPIERAYLRYLRDRAAIGDVPALEGFFCNQAIPQFLDPLLRQKNFKEWTVAEVLWTLGQVIIRLHIYCIAALEAEANSNWEDDPGPALHKYLPVIKRDKIEKPVSRYLTEVRNRFGIKTDPALFRKLGETTSSKCDDEIKREKRRESWKQRIYRLRRGTAIPEWDSINQIIEALDVGDERPRLLRTFAVVRYLQMVLEVLMKFETVDGLTIDHEETVRIFGEYENWYRIHAKMIRGTGASGKE